MVNLLLLSFILLFLAPKLLIVLGIIGGEPAPDYAFFALVLRGRGVEYCTKK